MLKTLGLVALMVRAGIPIPAAPGARVDLFDPVLADIGDLQSVTGDLSTFSGHLVVSTVGGGRRRRRRLFMRAYRSEYCCAFGLVGFLFSGCIALHCTAGRIIASHGIAPHSIAPHSIAPHSIGSHRRASHRIAEHLIALHRVVSHRIALRRVTLHRIFIALHRKIMEPYRI